MKNKKSKILVYTFYRFKSIKNINKIKYELEMNLKRFNTIKGTILIANEGINGSLAGIDKEIKIVLKKIKFILGIRNLSLKVNQSEFIPFYKLKVRIKNEIVTLGIKGIDVTKKTGNFIITSNWDKLLLNKKIITLDVRNKYERKIGYFKNSKNIEMSNFKEFPKKIKELNLDKKSKIAMYCTGGIRCEKASSYLLSIGYTNVMQLDGGIINYLNTKKKKSSWNGECFVFDNRVSVNSELEQGNYRQCHGCRSPLSRKDVNSSKYQKGVSCPNCYDKKSNNQKRRYAIRQSQINAAEKNHKNHTFKKVYTSDLL